jgi:hypothetical protein
VLEEEGQLMLARKREGECVYVPADLQQRRWHQAFPACQVSPPAYGSEYTQQRSPFAVPMAF